MANKRDLLAQTILIVLERTVFKNLIIRVLGAASTGWIGWLVREVYAKLKDKIVVPLLKMAINEGLTFYDEERCERVGIKFYKALDHNDLDGMKDAITDLEE